MQRVLPIQIIAALTACTAGAGVNGSMSDGGAASPPSAASPSSTSSSDVVLFRNVTEYQPQTDVTTLETNMELVQDYRVRVLYSTGFGFTFAR